MAPEDQTRNVDAHASSRSWGVEDRGWKHLRPDLSDDVIALLAPSIVVTATIGLATAQTAVAPRTIAPAPSVRRGTRRRTRG